MTKIKTQNKDAKNIMLFSMKKIIFLMLLIALACNASAANLYNYVYNGTSWVPMISTDDGQQKLWIEMKNCSYGSVQNNLYVDGKIGIGTTSPNEKLTVVGNVNATGNITLGQKITFALGEFIDNLVDGWLRITGNLNVTGDLNVIGNSTLNGLHFDSINSTHWKLWG